MRRPARVAERPRLPVDQREIVRRLEESANNGAGAIRWPSEGYGRDFAYLANQLGTKEGSGSDVRHGRTGQ